MKKIIIIVVLFTFVTSVCFSQNILIGNYSNDKGDILIIGEYSFNINDGDPIQLNFSNYSINGPRGGWLEYFIKPAYLQSDNSASLINLWIEESNNEILSLLQHLDPIMNS